MAGCALLTLIGALALWPRGGDDRSGDDPLLLDSDTISAEVVAVEVVRALVGSIGLIASVPIATWLAAVTVAGHVAPPPGGAEAS